MFDELRAMDYLASRPDVDDQRLGALGMSMGSTKAWWLAALDARARLYMEVCCLTDYEELIKAPVGFCFRDATRFTKMAA